MSARPRSAMDCSISLKDEVLTRGSNFSPCWITRDSVAVANSQIMPNRRALRGMDKTGAGRPHKRLFFQLETARRSPEGGMVDAGAFGRTTRARASPHPG